jgi:DNA mismatch repair protein MutH
LPFANATPSGSFLIVNGMLRIAPFLGGKGIGVGVQWERVHVRHKEVLTMFLKVEEAEREKRANRVEEEAE